jgi:DNA polymerase
VDEDRAWLIGQIKERLRFYGSMTSVGLNVPEPSPPAVTLDRESATAKAPGETLEQIRTDLGDCTRCPLHRGRRTLVFGTGNENADLMFVGEGPGYEEDVQGLPFVGPAGRLLDKIIQAIDMTRDDVYIANVVKCRPPGNRDPLPEEMSTCLPYLVKQIQSVRPRVICTLGRVAAQALLSSDKSLRELRGRKFSFASAVVVPTYHPAYLLRNPEKKRGAWEDMKLVRRLLRDER